MIFTLVYCNVGADHLLSFKKEWMKYYKTGSRMYIMIAHDHARKYNVGAINKEQPLLNTHPSLNT